MTRLSLKEEFAQRGLVRAIDRVPSGLPVDLIIWRGADLSRIRTIDATLALAKRGMTMLKAKRAVEAVVEEGEIPVHVPVCEDTKLLARDLARAGLHVAVVAPEPVDVARLRARLGMTQEQFALVYNIPIGSLRNWEQGKLPDQTTNNYLRSIDSAPEIVAKALRIELA
jgi:putative transcriptional regulator